MATTPHTHQMVFGRRVDGCPRCVELDGGAEPVRWAGSRRREDDEQLAREIREHDCSTAHCGSVCTFGQW